MRLAVRSLVVMVFLGMQPLACGAESAEDTDWSGHELEGVSVTTGELVGQYVPNAQMKNIRIRDWGGTPMLSASIPYPNITFNDVDFHLTQLEAGSATWVGSSSLRVSWGDVSCAYPIDIVVLVTRDAAGDLQLFIRDNRPVSFQDSLPSGASSCPRIANTWRTHPDPYMKRSPVTQFVEMVDDLCTTAGARVPVVDAAKRLTTGALGALPTNIYSASGDWQTHSTPGRDTTLRGKVRDIASYVDENTQGADGAAVARKLLAAWNERSAACRLSYKSSTGAATPLALGDVVKRAYKISFDPYHCPELRWGAEIGSSEYATCNTQSEAHLKRYNDEQTLRHHLDRPASGPTPIGSGPATGVPIDFVATLERSEP